MKKMLAGHTDGLRQDFTFETFAVGPSNRFAYNAARLVAELASPNYNPLCIYGDVGVGKTHLLHAVGHHLRTGRPNLTVLVVSGEVFVNEFVASVRFGRMPAFRKRYRTVDVLLVDEVDFICGKEKSEQELMLTLQALLRGDALVAVTAGTHPLHLGFGERVRSVLGQGLAVDIEPLNTETKAVIVAKCLRPLPDDVADLVVSAGRSARDLVGMANQITAYANLTGIPIDYGLAFRALRNFLPSDQTVQPNMVVREVAHQCQVEESTIRDRGGTKEVVRARHVTWHLLHRIAGLAYSEIARMFGYHHSSVMTAVENVRVAHGKNPELAFLLDRLERRFTSSPSRVGRVLSVSPKERKPPRRAPQRQHGFATLGSALTGVLPPKPS